MTYIKPPASHECTWRSGPPPEVGWWPASACKNPKCLRHWNGKKWSVQVYDSESRYCAELGSKIRIESKQIQWTDRWWLK